MGSNFQCDAGPGDELSLTGPSGKVMLIPEKDPTVDLIMVATGTGIAPYRSFLKRLFVEQTPFGEAYKGLAWLFLGVANTDALLYDDDWQEILKKYPDNFKLDYALSREQTNKDGGKMYIQGCRVLRRDLHPHGQWRAHVLLWPQGHDAGHHRDARGRLQGEGPRVGGQAQGVEEGRPVARRGLLDRLQRLGSGLSGT